MFDEYLDDYYKSKIGVKEMALKVGVAPSTFRRYLKRNNMLNRTEWYAQINTGIPDLDKRLKEKYSSIVNRCNGKTTDHYGHYSGKDYMTIVEWAKYCNDNKELLARMWSDYICNGKNNKYAISIDRIDVNLGYTRGNIEFVTHGFNSWKRTINPIKVLADNFINYFMSCEEASRHYGLRRQAIGECLNDSKYKLNIYQVSRATIKEVLFNNKIKSIKDYYNQHIK